MNFKIKSKKNSKMIKKNNGKNIMQELKNNK